MRAVLLSMLLTTSAATTSAVNAVTSTAAPAGPSARSPFFAPQSVWNARLSPGAPIDSRSATLVAELARQARDYGTTINTSRWSTPVYSVGRHQPRVRVQLDGVDSPALAEALADVPLPADARPAAGTDANVVVHQPATDTLWEFWKLDRRGDGWHARWGGRMARVSESPGYFVDRDTPAEREHWGATATSLAKVGGLILTSELRAGRIPHALAVGIPRARANVFAAPALRTDGLVAGPNAIPEGARFRLDPDLDLARLRLPRATRIVAEAAQRYGMIVNNQAGAVALYAEDPTPTGRDPYPALFGGHRPADLMRGFPWKRLRLVRMSLRTREAAPDLPQDVTGG